MSVVRRFASMRAEVRGNRLSGHAAVFGQYADLGSNLETLAPTAFDRVLKDPSTDVRALFNHDPSLLLGRQGAGTLRIGTDSQGLEFDVDLPNTSLGNDLRELVGRGDLDGASFAFLEGTADWTRSADGRPVQNHTSVSRLMDVSPCTFPAYEGAAVALRSLPSTTVPAATRLRDQLIRARARVLFGRD